MRYERVLEIILGAVFVLSAASKAIAPYDFAEQVSYYGVVTEPGLVQPLAYFMIFLESVFGVCLLGGFRFRGATFWATVALLTAFSGLILYAWAYRGLEDCGCFGKVIQMGPKASLTKNVVLAALAIGAWYGFRKRETSDAAATGRFGYLLATVGIAVVIVAAAASEPPPEVKSSETPFGKFVFTSDMGEEIDLGAGEYFVVMLSATCEHCQAVSPTLNELMFMPGVPTTVSLLLAESPDELNEFNSIAQPMFIIHPIPGLEWVHLTGKEPPRFYVVRDGQPVRHLDALEPTLEELHDFVTQDSGDADAANEAA